MILSVPNSLSDHVIKVRGEAKVYTLSDLPKVHCANDADDCSVSLYGRFARDEKNQAPESCWFFGICGCTSNALFAIRVFDILEHEQGPGIFLCAYINDTKELFVCLLMNFNRLVTGGFDYVNPNGSF
jgi:hypothetical protein